MINRIVVLGAVGDLATRHLLPALAHLLERRLLPSTTEVVAVGRETLTSRAYGDLVSRQLARYAASVPATDRAALVDRVRYVQADLSADPDLRDALGPDPVVAYLALPPLVYAPAVAALAQAGIHPASRIVVEKPFGRDQASARELSRLLHDLVDEQDVFRVDHFLYHQVVQDLLALRFANPLFEPAWNREHIERVDVIWEETAGITGRAEFYDHTGALRDMVQSHLLEVLALVAMERPPAFDAQNLRDARVAALRRVRDLTQDEVAARTMRGRYTAGEGSGQHVPGYVDEEGVDPARGTETYAWVDVRLDSPRWRGVPFTLRAGKALGAPLRRIRVHFRTHATGPLLGVPTVLTLDMAPDRMTLELGAAAASGLPDVQPVALVVDRAVQSLPASARLVRDVLAGDPALCVRDDEAEECWRIIESVTAGWASGLPPLQGYSAGSSGPDVPASP